MTSPNGYSSVTTPNPSVHVAPSRGTTGLTEQQVNAYGTAILDGVLGQVALALGNVDILGVKPFAFLTQWGQQLEAKAQAALEQAEGAQSTANTATSAAASAQSSADTAQATANAAQSNWTKFFEGFGVSVQTATAAATYITTVSTDLTNVINDGLAAFGWSSTGNAADFGSALSAVGSALFGGGTKVTPTSQVLNTSVASTVSGGTSLGHDVIAANGNASSAGDLAHAASSSAAQVASQISQLLSSAPAAPTGLTVSTEFELGITGIGGWCSTVYYCVTAVSSTGAESTPSGEASAYVYLAPMAATLSWNAVADAVSYRIYRGVKAGAESEYMSVTATTFTDTGA